MKKTFTYTRTLTVAALLLAFTAATAASIKTDDTGKCRKACCRKHKADKEMDQAMRAFNEAMKSLAAGVKAIDAKQLTMQINQAIATAPTVYAKAGRTAFVFATAPKPEGATDESQKINFANLDKEMDQMQEDMSQMDPTLKKEATLNQAIGETVAKLPLK